MTALCQRCGIGVDSWRIVQAEFNVGALQRWKVQLCPACHAHMERCVREALEPSPQPEGR